MRPSADASARLRGDVDVAWAPEPCPRRLLTPCRTFSVAKVLGSGCSLSYTPPPSSNLPRGREGQPAARRRLRAMAVASSGSGGRAGGRGEPSCARVPLRKVKVVPGQQNAVQVLLGRNSVHHAGSVSACLCGARPPPSPWGSQPSRAAHTPMPMDVRPAERLARCQFRPSPAQTRWLRYGCVCVRVTASMPGTLVGAAYD